jgi:hypothetical protein
MTDAEVKRTGKGDLWHHMDAQPRRAAASLTVKDIPKGPGVYAWYHEGESDYAGSATGAYGLRKRIRGEHLKTCGNFRHYGANATSWRRGLELSSIA